MPKLRTRKDPVRIKTAEKKQVLPVSRYPTYPDDVTVPNLVKWISDSSFNQWFICPETGKQYRLGSITALVDRSTIAKSSLDLLLKNHEQGKFSGLRRESLIKLALLFNSLNPSFKHPTTGEPIVFPDVDLGDEILEGWEILEHLQNKQAQPTFTEVAQEVQDKIRALYPDAKLEKLKPNSSNLPLELDKLDTNDLLKLLLKKLGTESLDDVISKVTLADDGESDGEEEDDIYCWESELEELEDRIVTTKGGINLLSSVVRKNWRDAKVKNNVEYSYHLYKSLDLNEGDPGIDFEEETKRFTRGLDNALKGNLNDEALSVLGSFSVVATDLKGNPFNGSLKNLLDYCKLLKKEKV